MNTDQTQEHSLPGVECACCDKPAIGMESRFLYWYCEDHAHTPPVEIEHLANMKARRKRSKPPKEVFDSDNPKFREIFEETIRAYNLPAARKGEGYRSPVTQWCFEVAYGVVNRLRLYESP